MRWWRVLGVAAFAGVAAGGVLLAKDERRRMAYTPDEVRERLHARLAACEGHPTADAGPGTEPGADAGPGTGTGLPTGIEPGPGTGA